MAGIAGSGRRLNYYGFSILLPPHRRIANRIRIRFAAALFPLYKPVRGFIASALAGTSFKFEQATLGQLYQVCEANGLRGAILRFSGRALPPRRLFAFTSRTKQPGVKLCQIMDADLICYQFSRRNVESADLGHFLSLYAPDKLPNGQRLRQMLDTFIFGITGYDEDPRELNSIPEVRRFYASLHKEWPYWLYFCNLLDDRLKLMILCCLKNVATLKVQGRANYVTAYNPKDLLQFVSDDFLPMNELCERAGMAEREIYDRSKAVFEYFGFPFDAKPPL
jgi:hypothetical protein